jgi:outer membrane protein assembly factor BamB
MWKVVACGMAVLAGCTEDTCELRQVVEASSATEPGTLQQGIAFETSASWAVAARSDGGVLCVTCNGLMAFDARLHGARVGVDAPRGVAVAPDDTIYALTPGETQDVGDLIALSPAGERRWKTEIFRNGTQGLAVFVATDEAAYVAEWTVGGGAITRFDAATGARRRVANAQSLLGVAGSGVFTGERGPDDTVALHQVDADGNATWSRALASTSDKLELRGAVATPDGGVVVYGSTPWTLDLGDRTFPVPRSPTEFVAGFDASGATQWVFAPSFYIRSITATSRGDLLIAGETGGGIGGPASDAYLSLVTAAGVVVRTLSVTGSGHQSIAAVAAAPDGLAWVQISSHADDNEPPPVMQIGEQTFAEDGTYLFKLVP